MKKLLFYLFAVCLVVPPLPAFSSFDGFPMRGHGHGGGGGRSCSHRSSGSRGWHSRHHSSGHRSNGKAATWELILGGLMMAGGCWVWICDFRSWLQRRRAAKTLGYTCNVVKNALQEALASHSIALDKVQLPDPDNGKPTPFFEYLARYCPAACISQALETSKKTPALKSKLASALNQSEPPLLTLVFDRQAQGTDHLNHTQMIDAVHAFLCAGADPNATWHGKPLLMHATEQGIPVEALQELLKYGADKKVMVDGLTAGDIASKLYGAGDERTHVLLPRRLRNLLPF